MFVKVGRYGPIVQIGDTDSEEKPKFAGLRKDQSMETITLEQAIKLFDFPRTLGQFENEEVTAAIGRFGPYVKHNSKFYSMKKEDDPYTITLERAAEIVTEKKKLDAEKEIQIFEEENIKVLNGRYGPYVTDGKKNARIPKETDPKSLSLEQCIEMLAKAKVRPKRKRAAKKKASKKKVSED